MSEDDLNYPNPLESALTKAIGFLGSIDIAPELNNQTIKFDENLVLYHGIENEYSIFYRSYLKDKGNTVLPSGHFLLYDFGEERKEKIAFDEGSEKFSQLATAIKLVCKNKCENIVHASFNDFRDKPAYYKPFVLKNRSEIFIYGREDFSRITPINLDDIKEVYSKLTLLELYKHHEYSRLKNSIQFFEYAYNQEWRLLKITLLFTTLESVFSHSNENIIEGIANRTASFLYPTNDQERQKLITFLKIGYDIRSDFVHGNYMNEDKINKKLAKLRNKEHYHWLWNYAIDLNVIVCDVLVGIIKRQDLFDSLSKIKPNRTERKKSKKLITDLEIRNADKSFLQRLRRALKVL